MVYIKTKYTYRQNYKDNTDLTLKVTAILKHLYRLTHKMPFINSIRYITNKDGSKSFIITLIIPKKRGNKHYIYKKEDGESFICNIEKYNQLMNTFKIIIGDVKENEQ